MTDPLTPPDLDLRAFTYMPLEVVRLRDSDLVVLASGEEFRAAVLLWCAAWHQVPAASLPNDERILANLAGFGRDLKGWRAVKTAALRGFVECSDGRLYHPVIAEKAIESGSKKRKQKNQTAAATEARRRRNEQRDVDRDDADGRQRNVDQGRGEERRGKEDAAPDGAQSGSMKTADAEYYRRAKEVLGPKGNSLAAVLLKAKDSNLALARSALELAATKENPREYLGAIIRAREDPECRPDRSF